MREIFPSLLSTEIDAGDNVTLTRGDAALHLSADEARSVLALLSLHFCGRIPPECGGSQSDRN